MQQQIHTYNRDIQSEQFLSIIVNGSLEIAIVNYFKQDAEPHCWMSTKRKVSFPYPLLHRRVSLLHPFGVPQFQMGFVFKLLPVLQTTPQLIRSPLILTRCFLHRLPSVSWELSGWRAVQGLVGG
jgi:hypothetical protein